MSNNNKKDDLILTKTTMLFISLFLVYFLIFFSSILSIMPNNPIKDKTQVINASVFRVLPQGWAFYSRSPRDNTYRVINTKTGERATQFPNASPNNYFGLSRYGRSQGVEVGRLISKINEKKWKDTTGNPIKFGRKMKKIKVVNDQLNPKVKGDIIIYYSDPIPWNWAKTFSKNNYMHSKVIRLEVTNK
ncbi:SdpA family antimicrobial peptide system protein [Staphylococcus epidermidis]|uniref:SdpA family antimicrobial peptide system protein n=1 Tax=Staphylococcus epidermidis TaxID=1282 RepID=UPI002DB62FA6|nr:SdpA family antimicrobial peptide system protein [Staphylococcus epidermidis]MEB7399869.1 SdpA family antimicrobial peptide system protein [Staphylococcus epidermidis]